LRPEVGALDVLDRVLLKCLFVASQAVRCLSRFASADAAGDQRKRPATIWELMRATLLMNCLSKRVSMDHVHGRRCLAGPQRAGKMQVKMRGDPRVQDAGVDRLGDIVARA
jgi:hypothetical protein